MYLFVAIKNVRSSVILIIKYFTSIQFYIIHTIKLFFCFYYFTSLFLVSFHYIFSNYLSHTALHWVVLYPSSTILDSSSMKLLDNILYLFALLHSLILIFYRLYSIFTLLGFWIFPVFTRFFFYLFFKTLCSIILLVSLEILLNILILTLRIASKYFSWYMFYSIRIYHVLFILTY